MLTLELLPFDQIDWESLDAFRDRGVHQSKAWLEFLAESQRATPVVAALLDGSTTVGYFSGMLTKRLGLRLLGSSLPGWTTPHIGFNLVDGFRRSDALVALEKWAFSEMRCMHFEVSDRYLEPQDGTGLDLTFYSTYETDLRKTRDALFGGLSKTCRGNVRWSQRKGVTIEPATGDMNFATDYYAQLQDVFAKQGLVPSYSIERVRSLVRHVYPTGNLLLLRALDPDGRCIATALSAGMGRVAHLWGAACKRSDQHWRPNEAIHWFAMQYWQDRGMEVFDWGGGGVYKEKFGVESVQIPWFYKSRFRALTTARNQARSLYYRSRQLMGNVNRRSSSRGGSSQ